MDDSDGAFSFPARQNDLRAEWAPSTGVARLRLNVVGSLATPAGIFVTVLASWTSGTPYSVLSGLDAEGNGLFTDRAGPRNSATTPATENVTAYAMKSVTIPARWWKGQRFTVDVGLRLENLLNRANPSMIGAVIGSPRFGLPLATQPGRSARITLTVH